MSLVVRDVHGERTTLATFGALRRPHAEVLASLLRRALGFAVPEARPRPGAPGPSDAAAIAMRITSSV